MAYSKQAASHYYRMRQFMQDNPGYFTFKQGQGMDWARKRDRRAPRRGPWWEKVSLAARRLRKGIPAGVAYSIRRTRNSQAQAQQTRPRAGGTTMVERERMRNKMGKDERKPKGSPFN